jgi:hypothetical protein
MGKIIRKTYPTEFSMGILLLIFIISGFLSPELFDVPLHDLHQYKAIAPGMFLVSIAVIIMVLIMWEEILFPIKLKSQDGGILFRNHSTKLKTQVFIYSSIPAIFIFVYLNYEVHHVRFIIWAAVCIIPPVIEKIASGINNYNDFLKLTNEVIQYKNNEKEGTFQIEDIQYIKVIKDDRNVIKKIQLLFTNNDHLTIDLDEMELEAFYVYINKYINNHYKHLLKP